MNSIEEYQNLVGLLQEALKFYANENNYMKGKLPEGEFDFNICIRSECRIPIPSMIDKDSGIQARFALKQAEDLIEQNRKMQEDYDRLIAASEAIQASEDMADPQKLIKAFKVLGNEDKNI